MVTSCNLLKHACFDLFVTPNPGCQYVCQLTSCPSKHGKTRQLSADMLFISTSLVGAKTSQLSAPTLFTSTFPCGCQNLLAFYSHIVHISIPFGCQVLSVTASARVHDPSLYVQEAQRAFFWVMELALARAARLLP